MFLMKVIQNQFPKSSGKGRLNYGQIKSHNQSHPLEDKNVHVLGWK